MRFLMLVNATQDSEAGAMPEEKLISAKASAHQELARAGTWLDASGPQPNSKGWCIKHSGSNARSSTGPSSRRRSSSPATRFLINTLGSRQPTDMRSDQEGGAMPSHRVEETTPAN